MNAWRPCPPDGPRAEPRGSPHGLHLEMLGWRALEERKQSALWQDAEGDLLGLVRIPGTLGLPRLDDEGALRRHCETMAASMGSRLVEAAVLDHVDGRAVMFVSRRVANWALVFTGILVVPAERESRDSHSWVWSVVARGQPATGDLRYLCDDCLCPAHPLARVRAELRKLLVVSLASST